MSRPPPRLTDRYTLADWGALVAALDAPDSPYERKYQGAGRHSSASHEWDLRAGWAKTREYAGAAGWPEGAAKIRNLTDRWIPQLVSLVAPPEYAPDITGEFFDVGVLMSGEPEHWYQRDPGESTISGPGKIHRVVVNLSASCGIDAADMVRRGAAVAALVAVLEATGAAVEVVVGAAVQSASDASRVIDISITIKQASDALDLDRLALMCVHPAGLRRIWFRLAEVLLTDEQRTTFGVRVDGNYGIPCDLPLAEQGDIYSPAMRGASGDFATDAGAEAWVIGKLRKLGSIQ